MLFRQSMLTHMEEVMISRSLDSGSDCFLGLRHPLAHARTFHRRVIVNGESAYLVACQLQLDTEACRGLVRLLRSSKYMVSDRRLAVVLQLDPAYTDEDVAEVFGQTALWSELCRRHAQAIRRAEPMNERLEWYDPDLQPTDPTPEEIASRAAELRSRRGKHEARVATQFLTWRCRAFIPICAS